MANSVTHLNSLVVQQHHLVPALNKLCANVGAGHHKTVKAEQGIHEQQKVRLPVMLPLQLTQKNVHLGNAAVTGLPTVLQHCNFLLHLIGIGELKLLLALVAFLVLVPIVNLG